MRYEVRATIAVPIEAESPEDAALEFASQLEAGELGRGAVFDTDEDNEPLVGVSEDTADGREITYYVALGAGGVRWVSEDRPFRFSEEDR